MNIYIWFAEPKPVYGGDGERFIRAWTDNPEKVAALQDAIGREPSVYRASAALAAPDSLIRRFVAALLTNDTEGSADIVKAMVDYVIPVSTGDRP